MDYTQISNSHTVCHPPRQQITLASGITLELADLGCKLCGVRVSSGWFMDTEIITITSDTENWQHNLQLFICAGCVPVKRRIDII